MTNPFLAERRSIVSERKPEKQRERDIESLKVLLCPSDNLVSLPYRSLPLCTSAPTQPLPAT